MTLGPLAVRFGDWTLDTPEAGAVTAGRVEITNVGTVSWGGIWMRLGYHWLDERGNPIIWDGERTSLPPLQPGESATIDARVRAPIPPGHYRFAFDVVAELRVWLSELGSPTAERLVDVVPRTGAPAADLPSWVTPAPDWAERVAAAHAEGFGVVAGAIAWEHGFGRRQPRALSPYAPGPGRIPGFSLPLLCPSVLPGIELERVPDVAGLPAYAAPENEPWIYDGRLVLRARPQAGRRSG
ncbi:MAG: hypothetical protein WCH31_06180 [Actinomycetes bacterium]